MILKLNPSDLKAEHLTDQNTPFGPQPKIHASKVTFDHLNAQAQAVVTLVGRAKYGGYGSNLEYPILPRITVNPLLEIFKANGKDLEEGGYTFWVDNDSCGLSADDWENEPLHDKREAALKAFYEKIGGDPSMYPDEALMYALSLLNIKNSPV